ncbi:MAG: hypothetical protein ASARMPRED_001773 [Alectoria sarmentosa]|nr:MAG: hypothetical protein ASARMPRED_001773 [Alectoria sarmentosa]
MPKAKPPKNLVVDGTAKLAAKSKPSDKHEAPDLNIEEATVASPRPSRKRAGDYFDFDNEDVDAEPSSKPAKSKAAKPNKKTKTTAAFKDEESNEVEAKPATTAKKGRKRKGAKDRVPESPTGPIIKSSEKEKKPTKPEVAKDDVAEEKPESSKKSKKATKEPAADKKLKSDATPETAKAETKTKAKKSKAEEGVAEQESSAIAPDIAMDEAPFEDLLDSEKGQAPGAAEKQTDTGPQATKAARIVKKPAKKSKASKFESAKSSAAETAAGGADLVQKGTKAGTEKVKKATKTKAPATETAADVLEVVKKGAKAGTEKAKEAAKSMAPAAQTAAGAADAVKKDAKTSAEKLKKGAKSKASKATEDDESVKLTGSAEEQAKPEPSRSKKRKTPPNGDTETVKTDILDPLSEHASAKKRFKKADTKSKSLGDAAGELLATATEGANVARASLRGLATSLMGGASEAAEAATDAKKSVKVSAKKAKGKGRAIAQDVAESSGKKAAIDGPGDADAEDDSNDEPDDHTTALLAGFESDGDEGPVSGSGFEQGQKIPPLPKAETTTKKLEDVKNSANEGPGVVYVGRIPHGFYEHEMREYFSQFGDISRLRLSRSRKNGASRHYAFVEFTYAGVAKVVADTMDNYLMFGHILKCKVVLKEQVHENLWKGANKRFKPVPWNKLEKRKFEMGLGREQWAGRIEGEKKRRESKNEKTKEIGYEFEAGELKDVDEVPVRDAAKKIEDGVKVEEEKSLVTAGGEEGNGLVVVSEEVKTKRVKKVKVDVGDEAVESAAKKAKKGRKASA